MKNKIKVKVPKNIKPFAQSVIDTIFKTQDRANRNDPMETEESFRFFVSVLTLNRIYQLNSDKLVPFQLVLDFTFNQLEKDKRFINYYFKQEFMNVISFLVGVPYGYPKVKLSVEPDTQGYMIYEGIPYKPAYYLPEVITSIITDIITNNTNFHNLPKLLISFLNYYKACYPILHVVAKTTGKFTFPVLSLESIKHYFDLDDLEIKTFFELNGISVLNVVISEIIIKTIIEQKL